MHGSRKSRAGLHTQLENKIKVETEFGKYSGAANPEYCNEASGWCGTAQDSTMILAPAQRQPRLKLNNEIV